MKRIRCPVHRDIPVEKAFLPLIDSTPVQRLRRIAQLGMANLVYPGANHTRFEHSMGVFHLSGLCALSLDLDDTARRSLQAAALLHDIGHGPFSHLSEELFTVEKPLLGRFAPEVHEQRGIAMACSDLTELLQGAGCDPGMVVDIMRKRHPFSAIIAADLDVDRMDYLVRDAHYAGVSTGVDPARLSSQFRLFGEHRIALAENGISSAESLLLARFLMYSAIYFHHAVRCAERMLMRAMAFALSDDGSVPIEQFIVMDDPAAWSVLRESQSKDCRTVTKSLLNRRLHKRILDIRYSAIRGHERLREMLASGYLWQMERELEQDAGLPEHSVYIDAPPAPVGDPAEAPILLRNGDVRPLHALSSVVENMQCAQLDHWRLRVFIPQDCRDDLEQNRKITESARSILFSEIELLPDEQRRQETEQRTIVAYE